MLKENLKQLFNNYSPKVQTYFGILSRDRKIKSGGRKLRFLIQENFGEKNLVAFS